MEKALSFLIVSIKTLHFQSAVAFFRDKKAGRVFARLVESV